MKLCLALIGVGMLVTGCATKQPYSDSTISAERKIYAQCAVNKAFSRTEYDEQALDIARSAIRQCDAEKAAVHAKLQKENSGKPGADAFAAAYVDQLHAVMVSHLATRLAQARVLRRAMEKNEKTPGKIKSI